MNVVAASSITSRHTGAPPAAVANTNYNIFAGSEAPGRRWKKGPVTRAMRATG